MAAAALLSRENLQTAGLCGKDGNTSCPGLTRELQMGKQATWEQGFQEQPKDQALT